MHSARFFLLFIFSLILFFIASTNPALAANPFLTMDPLQKAAAVGQTVNIQLAIDTANKDVIGAATVFTFEPADVEVAGISSTGWFETMTTHVLSATNEVRVTGGFYPVCDANGICENGAKRASGAVATMAIRLKRSPPSGKTTFTYKCLSGSSEDSSIIVKNPAYDPSVGNSVPGVEAVDCGQNKASIITVAVAPTAPAGTTSAPTEPTLAPGPPTCDLCGACQNKQGEVSKPPDWDRCRLCLYNSDGSQKPGQAWSGFGCVPVARGLISPFMQKLLLTVVGLTGGASFILFLYGGFLLITSRGDHSQIQTGKRVITGAVGALLVILFSIFILEFIGIHILGLPLQ